MQMQLVGSTAQVIGSPFFPLGSKGQLADRLDAVTVAGPDRTWGLQLTRHVIAPFINTGRLLFCFLIWPCSCWSSFDYLHVPCS
jgi:hypothetical protein